MLACLLKLRLDGPDGRTHYDISELPKGHSGNKVRVQIEHRQPWISKREAPVIAFVYHIATDVIERVNCCRPAERLMREGREPIVERVSVGDVQEPPKGARPGAAR